jgi:hypothetical protein
MGTPEVTHGKVGRTVFLLLITLGFVGRTPNVLLITEPMA